jgi:hypothetical protein
VRLAVTSNDDILQFICCDSLKLYAPYIKSHATSINLKFYNTFRTDMKGSSKVQQRMLNCQLAKCQDVDEMFKLVRQGAQVDTKDEKGETTLARCRNTELAYFLINRGADVDAKSEDGKPMLNVFAKARSADIVACLVKNGAKNWVDSEFGDEFYETVFQNLMDKDTPGMNKEKCVTICSILM